MVNERKKYGGDLHAGEACIIVFEKGIGDSRHPFWNWLRDEGFRSWGQHGNYGLDWVFININSMIFAPGMPGVKLASGIRNHAVTMEEFRTIWEIFSKYDGLPVFEMSRKKQDMVDTVAIFGATT